MATVKVLSRLGSPVVVQTWQPPHSDPNRAMLSSGPIVKASVVITPGENLLDPDFWREWKEQHKDTILLEHLEEEKQEAQR